MRRMAKDVLLSDTSTSAPFVSGSLAEFLLTTANIPSPFAIPVRDTHTGRPTKLRILSAVLRTAAEYSSCRFDQLILGVLSLFTRLSGQFCFSHSLSCFTSQLYAAGATHLSADRFLFGFLAAISLHLLR